MSCIARKCGLALRATGFGCTPVMEVAYKFALQPTYDSAGNRNKILFTDTLNQAFFQALIDQTDSSKRWNILPPMKNIDDARGDDKVFEFDDQTSEFLAEGIRQFKAIMAGGNSGANSPQMKSILDGVRDGDYSLWIITTKNQLVGNLTEDGLGMEGIEIDEASWSPKFMKKKNDTPQHIALSFNWAPTMSDASLRMFDCNEIGGASLTGLRAPIGFCYELVDSTPNDLTIKILSIFGNLTDPITADGLAVTDFVSSDTGATGKIYNATDDSDVTISSVDENPDGTYKLNFSAPVTVGDALIPFAKKSGQNFDCMKENPVEVES